MTNSGAVLCAAASLPACKVHTVILQIFGALKFR